MSNPGQSSRNVRFGDFELNLETAELRSNGSKAILPGQPFQVLIALLSRPGELVTREELKKQLWHADTFVDFDQSLNKAVNRLREALGDSAEEPRYVQTIARRGYRFITPVGPVESPVASAPLLADTEVANRLAATSVQERPPQVKFPGAVFHRKTWLAMGVALMLSLMGSGVYWFTRRQPSAPREIKLRQLTFNSAENAVRNGAISADGKYLAYIDEKGIHIRSLETGETQVVPEPEALNGTKVN